MFPQAKLQISHPLAMRALRLTSNYLVVGTVYGAFTILDLRCRHVDAEACEHRRDLQVGYTWFFDCCGDVLATASEDCKIRLWDLNTGSEQLTLIGQTGEPSCILFLNSTTIISGLKNGELNLWDIPSGTRRQTLVGHNDRINALQVHDNVLASGSSDRTGRIWDLNSTQCMCVLDDHGGYVGRLGFNADGSLLAAGAQDGETKIWDVASGTCRATCSGHTKIVTQFSNNSDNQLISCAADGTIRTWDWATGALVDTLQVYEDSDAHKNNALRGLAWSTDYLISGGMNGLLRAWDWRDHQSHIDLRVPNGSVYHLVSKGDLMVIAVNAGGGKHLIEVWDVSTLDLDGEIQRAALSRLSSTSTAQGGA